MKLVSWNVNGLRAAVGKGFVESMRSLDPDVICLQETKLQEGQIQLDLPGYRQYWSYAQKKGYSGTAVFTKVEPLQELHCVGVPELDDEGRICALEFPQFWLVDVYTPNAQNGLARIDHRLAWDEAFRNLLKGLERGVVPEGSGCCATTPKPVVTCGDLNVAHQEIDLKNPKSNRGNAGFSDEERESFGRLLDSGFADTWRRLNPETEGVYSWWSYRFKARENNAGWRIDYFLVSEDMIGRVTGADIHTSIFGSDHCPVSPELDV